MKHRALLFRISTASPTKSYDFDNNVAIILAAYGVVLDTPVAWKNSTPTIHASTARPTNVQNSDCMSRSLCTGQTAFVLTRVVYRQNLPSCNTTIVDRPISNATSRSSRNSHRHVLAETNLFFHKSFPP